MKIIHQNKKAYFNYEILEEFKAGIVLSGAEVKSIRAGHVNLKSAYVTILGGEAWLKGANIARYPYDSRPEYDPFRVRKLLLKKAEIEKLAGKLNAQGVTLIPLAVGLEKQYVKLVLGLARGKKKHDKRAAIKDRETKREAARAIQNVRR
ncbi:MAG: SsrA-binding protein SmpB [Candidatus Peregrinibacteria bacterium]